LIRSVLVLALLSLPSALSAAEPVREGAVPSTASSTPSGEPGKAAPAATPSAAPVSSAEPSTPAPAAQQPTSLAPKLGRLDAVEAEPAAAPNAKPADAVRKPDDTVERFRAPLDKLSERMIGTASRAVRFDWRQQSFGVAVGGGQLLELNNFNSARVGAAARTPWSGMMLDVALNHVFTWGSLATDKLAMTPYRQAGRPDRWELDLGLAVPLAEGVTTPRFAFLPVGELVLNVNVGFRYLYYWGELSGMSFGDGAKALFSTSLTDKEVENLESSRLPAMAIDRPRYNLMLGFSLDIYFQSGFYLSPRLMAAPMGALISIFSSQVADLGYSGLGLWWEMNLGIGWMFQ
jgi:hypothetical protein